MISINRLTIVLPVPVTALSQTTENDCNSKADETTRSTGVAYWIKSSPCPNKESNSSGKMLSVTIRISEKPELTFTILLINGSTSSCFCCPITLLTIVLEVAANAQEKIPAIPKTFRIVLETAKSRAPWCSIKM